MDKNLKYGIKYLCKQIKRYDGNMEKGVASHNAGGAYKKMVCINKGNKCKMKYINEDYVDIVYYNTLKLSPLCQ